MKTVARILVGLVGLFNASIGLGFLLVPARLAPAFALAPLGSQGLATVRADFGAFFLTGAAYALIGAWRADPKPLLVPLVLLAIALTGRFLGLVLDGVAPTAFAPIIAETGMIGVLLVARASFR